MIRLKQYVKILSLFALLFVVVFVPAFFIKYQHNHSFNQTVLYPVDAVQFGSDDGSHDDNPPVQDYSIWDRIKLIGSSSVVIHFAEYTDLQANANLQESLLPIMEEQLMLLQNFHALPDLSFSDVVSASFYKKTYMAVSPATEGYTNISKPESMIHIWEIQAEYRDFHVIAYMDADTSALYDITISSKGSDFLYPSSISEVGFLEYLLEFSDGENKSGDVFSAGGFYSGKMICLYPLSVDKQTGQIVSYRIGGPYDMEALEVSEYKVSEMPPTEN